MRVGPVLIGQVVGAIGGNDVLGKSDHSNYKVDKEDDATLPQQLFDPAPAFSRDTEIPSIETQRTLFSPCLKANKGCVCISSLYTPAPLSFMKTDCWPASRAIISQIPHLFTFFTRLRYVRPIRVPEEIASTYSATFFQTRALWHVQKNLSELRDLFQTVQALAFLTVFLTGMSNRASKVLQEYAKSRFDARLFVMWTSAASVRHAWIASVRGIIRRRVDTSRQARISVAITATHVL